MIKRQARKYLCGSQIDAGDTFAVRGDRFPSSVGQMNRTCIRGESDHNRPLIAFRFGTTTMVSVKMRLWTIQAEAAYRCLAERGEYIAKPSFSDPDFVRPYEWMLDQMSRRLPPIAPRPAAAIWAWRKWNPPERNRPDLRARGHLPSGCVGYRLEREVHPSQVLLSDFNLWHHVLNYFYVPASQGDSRRFDAEHDPFRFGWSSLPPEPLHNSIATSCERIFELDWYNDYVTGDPASRPIQATLWRIDGSMVCSSRRFVAR